MDAKPQRPLRTLRVFGDENAMPGVDPQKTLHHRNKSSPALSSIHAGGGLKAAAKRTAFGDVSNTANAFRPSKDDSAIGAKPDKLKENIPQVHLEKKVTTFQRPAQRPLSVNAGLKSILSNVNNSSIQSLVKQPLVELPQPSQQASHPTVTRKVTAKKSTKTFKDTVSVQEEKPAPDLQKPFPSTASVVVHRELPPQPITKSSDKIIVPLPQPNRAPSNHLDAPEAKKESLAYADTQPTSEDDPALRSDGIYIDRCGQVQTYRFIKVEEKIEGTAKSVNPARSGPPDAHPKLQTHLDHISATQPLISTSLKELETTQTVVDPILVAQNSKIEPELVRKQRLAPVSEPEEYWEEEEGAENFDEEGYVTARSFKSRGENTTGGATTVLFPKVTLKAKKEIALAKELVENSKTAEELEDEAWDTTMVTEYGEEIFQYMRDLEIKMLPNANYMDNQAEIQWSMRAVLMDWIVQVHHRFNLLPETLYLCVNYIDRFLSSKVVSLGKLQLVGATAIFIAAKYEEIDCPSVQEINYMVDGGYTIDEILKAERFMLSMLQFELGWPGPMSFLRRISKADDYDLETRTLAKYFLEITIMDERFVGSPPSFVAAGAHCLARMMLRKGNWSPSHVYYSDYTYPQLFTLVLLMVECCEDARKHHCAVYDKYTDKRYKRASTFAESEMRRGFMVADVTSNSSAAYANPYDSTNVYA